MGGLGFNGLGWVWAIHTLLNRPKWVIGFLRTQAIYYPPIWHPLISNASRGPSSHYLAGNFQNQIGTLFLLKDMMIRRTIICRIGMIKTWILNNYK